MPKSIFKENCIPLIQESKMWRLSYNISEFRPTVFFFCNK